MRSSDIIVLTPPLSADPSLAIAACRAGSKGTLDLESPATPATVEKLARFAPAFGVRVGPTCDLAVLGGSNPGWVVLTANHPQLKPLAERFRAAGAEVLVEAISVEEAARGTEVGADGIILKGHEAGGRVGADTAFVLVQKWRRHGSDVPFWVQGGVGPNTAAACLAAGARGVVLDAQVLLARESPLGEAARRKVASLDGGETAVLGGRLGEAFRCYSRADSAAFQELTREEDRIHASSLSAAEKLTAWRAAVRERVGPDGVWLVGQDAGVASSLAAAHVTVAGIVRAVADGAAKLLDASRKLNHLAEGAPLAKSHGTRYPILQGPMTRVSDTAAFADAVAAGGGLPFLALALLRKAEAEKLLADTKKLLGKKPWGVGVLGFVPPEIRAEQLAAITAHKPPFAIIAGGRPDQAKELEQQGIPTYLHVPSPGLLRMFLKDGARRFIFEGQECGGHVGPRASFALWESMTQVLLDHVGQSKCDDLHVVFAGGIHDGLSAGMVAALSAGLAEKGVNVGVLLGTAYLFTEEAVAAGAITAKFQKEALACGDTVLLETGPGHAIRCIPTPYADTFETEKARLKAEGKSPQDIILALERMNLGRLRVASKGVDRAAGANGTGLASVSDDDQLARGMYMIGQVAALHDEVTTVTKLHADVAAGVSAVSPPLLVSVSPPLPAPPPCDVAIIGMACFYPKAGGLHEYWENILNKTNAVIEIPGSHWDWRPYYDPDPRAKDKMVSKWGGFMSDVVFEPLAYGITPKSIPNIEPLQLLLLEAVRQAIDDAGYANRPFERERAAAILGVGGGGMPLSVSYGFRACMPLLDSIPNVPIKSSQIVELGEGILPEWTEDSFPGILLNVAAGRVANRFNFGGPNMAIDAACGSSLAALYAGVRELNTGTSDIAVVMGADCVQTPYAYVAFSKTHALSPKGRCRPFDAQADGIALAEGIGVMVMKRLADAERDGDRIYAVVKGVGASSDGRDKGLTAPRAEGQLRALERAYAQARVSPARVGLVEAHGTGTVVGDQTEARALGQVFRAAGGLAQSCALGSVKSMIGHSKCAAGLAGLIKASLGLHHKMLPPTLAETPNPKANLDGGPLFLNTEVRPWVHGADHPRTAGVSAFGFGGTNFHAVLEEYTGDFLHRPSIGFRKWPAELFVWRRADVPAVVKDVTACRDGLKAGATPALADLAASVWQSSKAGDARTTLAVVATSLDDLREKLDIFLSSQPATDPRGIYFAADGVATPQVTFLFPGQGSQYPDMMAQAAAAFPEVRSAFDAAERTLMGELDRPLGKFVYPPSAFTPEQEAANRKELTRTEVAQPVLGAASLGMFRLLAVLGVEPDALAGHSYGEYAALAAAGAMSDAELFTLSHRRGQVIKDAAANAPGGMAAVDAPADVVEAHLKGVAEAWLANHNSPSQTVIAGTDAGLKAATEKLTAAGLKVQRIPVACGFHTPLIAAAKQPLADALARVTFGTPRKPVYSNTTTKPHGDASTIAAQLAEHLVSPVRFAAEIEAMYAAGVRVFVECGPQGVLTGLTTQTLAGKPHLAVASDAKARPGLVQLMHLLGQLAAAGVRVNLDRLFQGRGVQAFDAARMTADTGKSKPSAMAWVVNGVRSRPINGPEPRLLGQALPAGPEARSLKAEASKPKPPLATPPSDLRPLSSGNSVHPTPRAKMHTHDTPSANGHHDPLPSVPQRPAGEGSAQVMAKFQDVMAKFLDTQRSVMLGFLGRDPGLPAPSTNGRAAVHTNGNGNGHAAKPKPPAVVNRIAAVEPKPVAKAEPTPVAATPKAGPLDRDALMAKLLDLVSDRTGYPKDALTPDLDLEADLGIDSIKRVEVLGALAETIEAGAGDARPNLEMEKLSVLKTLRGIADYVAGALADAKPATAAPKPADAPHPGARSGEVQRLLVELIDAPLPARPSLSPPGGTVVVTDDGQGTARELADRLGELDVNTVIVRHSTDAPGDLAADLTDPDAVAQLVGRLKEKCGPIAGLIHLLPLAVSDGESPADRARREVKSLYLLARALEADIRDATKTGPAVLLAVTALGGTMGYGDDLPTEFFAGHGGIAGFTKCLAHEWPGVTVRVVDVDAETPASRLAEQLLAELGDPDGPVEVGVNGSRTTWQCNPGPLDTTAAAAVELNADSTVLITGGARGITAKIAGELAARHKCKLVLVGSSPEPVAEHADTTPLTSPAELKAALTKLLAADGKPSGPPAVEASYRRLLKDREIRGNLADIRAAGGTVDYRAVDVKDAAAFGALIDELNAKGGIDAVIHGAGVIEDKLLRDKTPESFDRVFGTKVNSAFTLAAKLDPARVKFFALFASITSRYGNRGQCDYAAANEVLSKLACDLDRRWPGRVVSVAWGPWAEVGMVAELEKHLVARGLKLISPEQGAAFAADELAFGRKGTPEVVFAGGTEAPAKTPRAAAEPAGAV